MNIREYIGRLIYGREKIDKFYTIIAKRDEVIESKNRIIAQQYKELNKLKGKL